MKIKKILCLSLAVLMCACFASCSKEPVAEEPEIKEDDVLEEAESKPIEESIEPEKPEIPDIEVPEAKGEKPKTDKPIIDESSIAGLPFEGYNTDPPQITAPNEPVEEINYPPTTTQPYFISFKCYVNEINEDDMIVNPVKTSHEYNVIGEISIPLSAISDGSTPSRGDCYEIHYKGDILKTSPGTLDEILSVELVATGNKK